MCVCATHFNRQKQAQRASYDLWSDLIRTTVEKLLACSVGDFFESSFSEAAFCVCASATEKTQLCQLRISSCSALFFGFVKYFSTLFGGVGSAQFYRCAVNGGKKY